VRSITAHPEAAMPRVVPSKQLFVALAGVVLLSGGLCQSNDGTYDALAMQTFGRVLNELTTYTTPLATPPAQPTHPIAGSPAGEVRPSTTLKNFGAAHVTLTETDTKHAGLTCGDHGNYDVLCSVPDDLPAGVYTLLWEEVSGVSLAANDALHLQYGFVVDSAQAHNYEPTQYPNDFFFGTDRWITITKAPGEAPVVKVQDAQYGTITDVTAKVRVVVTNDRILVVAAPDVFPGAGPLRYRITIHEHTGDHGRQQPWSGLTQPNVGQPLVYMRPMCPGRYRCGEELVSLDYGEFTGCTLRLPDSLQSFSMDGSTLTPLQDTAGGTYTTLGGELATIHFEDREPVACIRVEDD